MQEEVQIDGSRRRSRGLLAAFFVGAGVNHFVMPRAYEAIVPPSLAKDAGRVVQISGIAEVAGGLGVLLPWTRRAAGRGARGAAGGGVPREPLHGPNPRALRADPALGAVRAPAAAADDDVVGMDRHAAMSSPLRDAGPPPRAGAPTGVFHEPGFDAAMFGG